MDFDFISGKSPNEEPYVRNSFWDKLPGTPKIQSFYESFAKAEGWAGEVYLVIWTESEVASIWCSDNMGLPKDFLFFGGTGDSNGFGCHWLNGKETYFSAQFVSDLHKDRTDLGDWYKFRKAILEGAYI